MADTLASPGTVASPGSAADEVSLIQRLWVERFSFQPAVSTLMKLLVLTDDHSASSKTPQTLRDVPLPQGWRSLNTEMPKSASHTPSGSISSDGKRAGLRASAPEFKPSVASFLASPSSNLAVAMQRALSENMALSQGPSSVEMASLTTIK